MEEYIRIVNDNGTTKAYYKSEDDANEVWIHELENGESIRICVSNGKLASINEKRL